MKNQTNKILLSAFLLTGILYVLDVLLWLEIISIGQPVPYHIFGPIALIFSAVPAFCFQLLLCRAATKKWITFLPATGLGAVIFISGMKFVLDSGWDSLGWLIILLLCIAPAAGCGLALTAERILKKRKQKGTEA